MSFTIIVTASRGWKTPLHVAIMDHALRKTWEEAVTRWPMNSPEMTAGASVVLKSSQCDTAMPKVDPHPG